MAQYAGIEYVENAHPGKGMWKFVRVNGIYRFTACGIQGGHHTDLLKEGEIPESAGLIAIFDDKEGKIYENFSQTLDVGMDNSDKENLSKLLSISLID